MLHRFFLSLSSHFQRVRNLCMFHNISVCFKDIGTSLLFLINANGKQINRNVLWFFVTLIPIFGSIANAENFSNKVKDFVLSQKYQEAFNALQELEKTDSNTYVQNPEMLWLKGYLEFQLDKKVEARTDLQEVMKLDSWRAEAAYYLALIESREQNYKKALELLNQAEKSKANQSLKMKIEFEKAQTLVFYKKWKDAVLQIRKTEKLLKGDAKYSDLLKLMAKVNLELKNKRGACKIVEKIYTKFPLESIFKEEQLPFLDKLEILGSQLSCTVDDELFSNHRRALFGLGRGDLANKEIDFWIDKNRLSGYEKDLLLANKNVNEGNFTQALDVLLNYYESKKNHVPYLMLLSSVAARSGNFSLSIGANYRVFQLTPNTSQKRKSLFQSAIFSFQIQDYDGAQFKFEKYVQSFPRAKNTIDAKWYVAWIQYLKGHYKESSEYLTTLLKESRKQKKAFAYREKIQYWLAMCFLKMGDVSKSRLLLAEVIKNTQDISFYSVAAHQRMLKLNDLGRDRNIANTTEINSLQRVSFKMYFANAENFLESPIIFENTSTDESTIEERKVASTAEEVDVADNDGEDSPEEEKIELVDSSIPDDLSAEQTTELQAKIDKARFLTGWGFDDLGRSEYNDIERYIVKSEKNKNVIEDYQKLKDYFRLSTLSYNIWSRRGAPSLDNSNRFMWENMYPLAYKDDIKKWTDEFSLPQALVWGIMKAESQYRPWVVSPVGAQGLMQIMPFTGKKVSELLGESQFSTYSLKDPGTAIKIGSKYLQRLANNFNGSVPLIAAAYNAGPHRVQNWVYNFGYLEMDEWIEHIPYNETRMYVKRVTSNYFAYLNLYGEAIKSKKISLVDQVPVQINEPTPLVERWD